MEAAPPGHYACVRAAAHLSALFCAVMSFAVGTAVALLAFAADVPLRAGENRWLSRQDELMLAMLPLG
eukprot:2777296-Pleurochrysis_carterae.AAC.5